MIAAGCARLSHVAGTGIRETRPEDASGVARTDARVYAGSRRVTRRGSVPDSSLDAMSFEESEERWRTRFSEGDRRAFTFVAGTPEGVAGFAPDGPRPGGTFSDYDAELHALYLLRERQGEGSGKAGKLSEAGRRAVIARVMARNAAARGSYEAHGGKLVRRDVSGVSGESLEEVAYGRDGLRDPSKDSA